MSTHKVNPRRHQLHSRIRATVRRVCRALRLHHDADATDAAASVLRATEKGRRTR